MATRRSWLWIPLLLLTLVVIFGLATWLLNRLVLGAAPDVAEGSVLRVQLQGGIAERPTRLFGAQPVGPLAVREIDAALREAAGDDRIVGVLLDVGPLTTGFAKAQELRAAIHAFRDSGKPIVALLELGTLLDLYVATAAETVVQIPTGNLVVGLVNRNQYYKELLDRLGIGVDVFHTGDYKTAMNPYTETDMSPAEREAINSLLDSVWSQILEGIADDRELVAADVEATLDLGLLDGAEMIDHELADELAFRDRALEIAGDGGDADTIGVRDYNRAGAPGSWSFGRPEIALVHVGGMIVPGDVEDGPFGDAGVAAGDTIARYLRQARQDEDVRAIVLRIDSGGGALTASDVIYREAELAAEAKPLIVSMSDVAASGGYWIALAGDRILADPATFTGSIGVVSARFNLVEAYEKIGIDNASVQRGRNADLFLESERLTPEQEGILQRSTERHYATFVEKVAGARGLAPERVRELAAGRVWTGAQAAERQLIDELGGLRAALRAARVAAGIAETQAHSLREYPESVSLFDGILGLWGVSATSRPVVGPLGVIDGELQRQARVFTLLSRGGKAWALTMSPLPAPAN